MLRDETPEDTVQMQVDNIRIELIALVTRVKDLENKLSSIAYRSE